MPRTPPADLRLFYLNRAAPRIEYDRPIQSYFPSLEVLFPSLADNPTETPTLAATELIVDVSNGIGTVEDLMTKVVRKTPVWIRSMHLAEPIDVMSGEYVLPTDGGLPACRGPWQRALRKINDPYNEAYTDAIMACMASRLVETGRSPHFCRFYGTFNTRAPTYSYDITQDMPNIEGESWYREGLASGAFKIIAVDPYDPSIFAEVTRPWENVRSRLDALANAYSLTASSTDSNHSEVSSDTDSDVSSLSELEEADIPVSGTATVRPRVRLERVESGMLEPLDDEDDEESEEEDDTEYRVILENYPVQITVIERGDGTMDELIDDEVDNATEDMRLTKEQRWTAWIFQVVAALTTAQATYDFVHNDLHAGNVLWTGTGETHLYYHVRGAPGGDRFYRVPTFGRIMKIIDFGRATFRPPATSNGNRLWFPDAYAPDADAGGQYNCGPYFNRDEPKVTPNKSFDLCRLAIAMLESLWPERPADAVPARVLTRELGRIQNETVSPLWNLVWMWLTAKDGHNIMLNPDDTERYPNFDLYCAIARDATNAVPAQQLTLPLFDSAFRCSRDDIPADATVWKLHAH